MVGSMTTFSSLLGLRMKELVIWYHPKLHAAVKLWGYVVSLDGLYVQVPNFYVLQCPSEDAYENDLIWLCILKQYFIVLQCGAFFTSRPQRNCKFKWHFQYKRYGGIFQYKKLYWHIPIWKIWWQKMNICTLR